MDQDNRLLAMNHNNKDLAMDQDRRDQAMSQDMALDQDNKVQYLTTTTKIL